MPRRGSPPHPDLGGTLEKTRRLAETVQKKTDEVHRETAAAHREVEKAHRLAEAARRRSERRGRAPPRSAARRNASATESKRITTKPVATLTGADRAAVRIGLETHGSIANLCTSEHVHVMNGNRLAFLSARVPHETRNRLKSLAARRGLTVQELLRKLVDEYLTRENERQPTLTEVVARLRRRSDLFRSKGVRRLAVFGSAARGEGGPQSDIDIAVEYEPGREPSLSGFAGLREDLRDLLGRDVDLADWRTLRSDVRAAVDREAIDVL